MFFIDKNQLCKRKKIRLVSVQILLQMLTSQNQQTNNFPRTYLPKPLQAALKILPEFTQSKTELHKARFFIWLLYINVITYHNSVFAFHEIPRTYLKKALGNNYKRIKEILFAAKIIIPYKKGIYSKQRSICKAYAFNPEIHSGYSMKDQNTLIEISFPSSIQKKILLRAKKLSENQYLDKATMYTKRNLKKLKPLVSFEQFQNDMFEKYLSEAALQKNQSKYQSIELSQLKAAANNKEVLKISNLTGNQIFVRYGISSRLNDSYQFLGVIRKLAKENGLQLVKYSHKGKIVFYLIDVSLKAFALRSQQANIQRIFNNFVKLQNGKVRATRNKTNNRLDHNLTNCSKEVLQYFSFKNQRLFKIGFEDQSLFEIDLKNSQPTILAFLIDCIQSQNKTFKIKGLEDWQSDLKNHKWKGNFQKSVIAGNVYDTFASLAGITRTAAKVLIFRCIFSDYTNDFPEKKLLEKAFPDLVFFSDYLKAYFTKKFAASEGKKASKLGSSFLPTFLATIESKVFVDTIYKKINEKLNSKDLFCITKHDSIIVNEACKDQALLIAHEILFSWFGKYVNLKVSEIQPAEPEQAKPEPAEQETEQPEQHQSQPAEKESDLPEQHQSQKETDLQAEQESNLPAGENNFNKPLNKISIMSNEAKRIDSGFCSIVTTNEAFKMRDLIPIVIQKAPLKIGKVLSFDDKSDPLDRVFFEDSIFEYTIRTWNIEVDEKTLIIEYTLFASVKQPAEPEPAEPEKETDLPAVQTVLISCDYVEFKPSTYKGMFVFAIPEDKRRFKTEAFENDLQQAITYAKHKYKNCKIGQCSSIDNFFMDLANEAEKETDLPAPD